MSLTKYAILIGASSSIAQAMCKQLLASEQVHLLLISSKQSPVNELRDTRVTQLICDYSPTDIDRVLSDCDRVMGSKWQHVTQVFIFNGVLHSQQVMPEKRIEDVNASQLASLYHTNTITPFMFVSAVISRLDKQCRCRITVFSARVGSIEDNRLGGWYGYRSSKAALNMLLKTATIELKRRAKDCKIIAFHPGTTDTPLSKPFQKNVPQGKLFTPEYVARSCLLVTEALENDGELSYVDWQGKEIAF
ncbi:SDR family NAD(P)-dependent oxidoreductase [Thalassotalea sp. Y01]|uniref:SDR family NAD(P)-dependent oxidoreductase n=1 Tax=Thalassotalea sp. Y01 TaxID=2729613 RepID=UPI00145D283F|nr:SDR family NAD(P)-dependent oxidoreductase [Thalassotalea sp. Y01]NMP17909.1 SDR family NAD(P)-dependent oxidoreductase [Thalassotalea sp. Y01]